MDSNKDKQKNIVRLIENNMAPRFGHTITLGKIHYLITL